MKTYDPLRIPAPRRLSELRKAGSTWKTAGGDWRVRAAIGANPHPNACPGWNGQGRYRTPILSSFRFSDMPARSFELAHDVKDARIRHTGWFADYEGHGYRGTVQGIVAHLPHGRYLVGYHWTDNGEYVLEADRTYADKTEAARAADESARIYAESLREDDERFSAMTDAESLCESKAKDVEDAYAARNTTPRNRQWARDAVKELRDARAELERATEAYERG